MAADGVIAIFDGVAEAFFELFWHLLLWMAVPIRFLFSRHYRNSVIGDGGKSPGWLSYRFPAVSD